jgi:iron complex transport system substrate-binding protein
MRLILPLLLMATPALALDCAEGQRPFAHHGGETCIPETPQRIVTLQDQNGLLPLMELGVTPVGSAGFLNDDGSYLFRRMQGYATDGVAFVGDIMGPDPEAVAALAPDLIIATPWDDLAIYSAIAPTIAIDVHDQPLDAGLRQFADAVNRLAEVETLAASYEAHLAQARQSLAPVLAQATISVIDYDPDARNFWVGDNSQSSGMVFERLGVIRPAADAAHFAAEEARSLESIADHAADIIFVMVWDAAEGGSDTLAAFLAEPVVQTLPAARAGQVFALDGSAMVGSAWSKPMNGLDQVAAILSRPDLDLGLVAE